MENSRKHFFFSVLVNGCTSLNLVLGMASIFNASMGRSQAAAWCLVAAVLLDAADGYLARRWQVTSEFGAQLDSLADMTSFNIAGAALTFYWFSPPVPPILMGAVSALYAVMGACRLARFNSGPKLDGEFQGMPTTAVASMVAVTHLASPDFNGWMGVWLVALLAVLMVTYFPYPKFSRILKYPVPFWFGLALAAKFSLPWTMWGCIAVYILSGPLIWLQRRGQSSDEWVVTRRST